VAYLEVLNNPGEIGRTMFEHISKHQMERYRDRKIDSEELLSVNRHLVSCEQCRSQYNDLAGADSSAVLHSMLEPNWLTSSSRSGAIASLQPRFGKLSLALAIALIAVVGLTVVLLLRYGSNAPGQQTADGSGAIKQPPSIATPSPEPSPVVGGVTGGDQQPETAQVLQLQKPQELSRIVRSEIVTLKGPGGDAAFSLLHPVGTFVLNTQPILSWSPVKDVTRYEVSMRPLKGTRSIFTTTTTKTSYTPTAGILDAFRGQVLQWSVTAQLPNGEEVTAPGIAAPEALFVIADETKARKIEALAQHEKNELIRAKLFANSALLDDAERELDSYLKNHPRDPDALGMLLTIRSWRRKE